MSGRIKFRPEGVLFAKRPAGEGPSVTLRMTGDQRRPVAPMFHYPQVILRSLRQRIWPQKGRKYSVTVRVLLPARSFAPAQDDNLVNRDANRNSSCLEATGYQSSSSSSGYAYPPP
jgi:hypothetical protein